MTTTCTQGIANELSNKITNEGEGGYSNVSCDVNNNNVSFAATLDYPGARRYLTIKVQNDGTLPAKLNTETGFTSNVEYCIDSNNDGTYSSNECSTSSALVSYFFERVDIILYDGTSYYSSAQEDEGLAAAMDENGNFILQPNQSFYVVFKLEFSSIVENSGTFNGRTTADIQFNFEQA